MEYSGLFKIFSSFDFVSPLAEWNDVMEMVLTNKYLLTWVMSKLPKQQQLLQIALFSASSESRA